MRALGAAISVGMTGPASPGAAWQLHEGVARILGERIGGRIEVTSRAAPQVSIAVLDESYRTHTETRIRMMVIPMGRSVMAIPVPYQVTIAEARVRVRFTVLDGRRAVVREDTLSDRDRVENPPDEESVLIPLRDRILDEYRPIVTPIRDTLDVDFRSCGRHPRCLEGIDAARSVVAEGGFGANPQALRPLAQLQDGMPKLA